MNPMSVVCVAFAFVATSTNADGCQQYIDSAKNIFWNKNPVVLFEACINEYNPIDNLTILDEERMNYYNKILSRYK